MKIKQLEWIKNIYGEWVPNIPSVIPSFIPNYKIVHLLSDAFRIYLDDNRLLLEDIIGFEKSKLIVQKHFENCFRRCIEND